MSDLEFYEHNPIDKEISLLVQARYPILSILTYEEMRVLTQLEHVREQILAGDPAVEELQRLRSALERAASEDEAQNLSREIAALRNAITAHPILRWSITDGVYLWSCWDNEGNHQPRPVRLAGVDPTSPNPVDVMLALRFPPSGLVDGVDLSSALFVFCDLHIWLDREDRAGRFNHILVRAMRDLSYLIKLGGKIRSVILLSPRSAVPMELQKDIQVLDYPLPTLEDLERRFEWQVPGILQAYGENAIQLDRMERRRLMQALRGLTYDEAENVLSRSLTNNGRLEANDIAEALREKRQIIQKDGTLEYFESEKGLADVGGLEDLLNWLVLRRMAFLGQSVDVDGREIPLPTPKAVLLIGVPGGGKSLVAKAVARAWELPLLRLDIGRIFGGLVGQSEENMRRALRIAESLAPTVVWLDEVEKAFPRTTGSTDSGTSLRVMNTFLTWLQEKKAPVFVVATGNDIEQLPPELTRKGRFDEIFYVGLPDREARRRILEIHTQRFPLESADYDRLAEQSKWFTGAEIEQAVSNALFLLPRLTGGDEPDQPDSGLRSPLARAVSLQLQTTPPLAQRRNKEGKLILAETLRRAKVLAIPASARFEELPDEQTAQPERWGALGGLRRLWKK